MRSRYIINMVLYLMCTFFGALSFLSRLPPVGWKAWLGTIFFGAMALYCGYQAIRILIYLIRTR